MKSLIVLVSFLVTVLGVCGDTFDTGASTNTIPGALTVTGAAQFNVTISLTNDVILSRESANTLAMVNSTNPQSLYLYGTKTDSANYERLKFITSSSGSDILASSAGTGVARPLRFGASNIASWQVGTNGNLLAVTDATYNIGAQSANRPNDIFASHVVTAGSGMNCGANGYFISNKSGWTSGTDGIMTLYNNNANDFNRLGFGGTTASFPSLKRSTTNIVARLADDSADAGIQAAYILFGTNVLSFNGTNLTWNGVTITVP